MVVAQLGLEAGERVGQAEDGHLEMVEFLLANKATFNVRDDKGLTPLHMAADYDHVDVAKWLLDHGADVNARDKQGRTPLHLAAWDNVNGSQDIVDLLLARNADVNARDNAGNTPLHYAALEGKTMVVDILGKHGGHE